MAHLQYLPGDPRLVDQLVYELKSKGIFDQFRKECIADVDTRPAYQNLRQRVESSVSTFLSRQCWKPDLNKNQLREKLRKHVLDGNYLEQGVERIVDQVVNPKVASVFMPQVEDLVYNYLGITRKKSAVPATETSNGKLEDLLPTDLEAVSPGSVNNDDKDESMDLDSKDDTKMDVDDEVKEVKEDTVLEDDTEKIEVQDIQLPSAIEVTSNESDSSVDKASIPLPTEEIRVENIPPPDNSPPKVELEDIQLPKEPDVSTDIPLPDEIHNLDKETCFKPINVNSEEDDSSSDSSLRRNMSPLTPIRNFNNENSCDAQQAFENDLDSKSDGIKEPSSFRFTIETKSPENIPEAAKPEKKETEQTDLSYQFNNKVNINTFNTPLYEDSSNSNNLQIDYESDANSKINNETKVPEAENSSDSKKERKPDEKRSSHKSSHRSRDSYRHSTSKDKRSDSKQSSSRDSSRHDKKSKDDHNKSKSSHKERERSKDRSEKKDSRDSSKHRSSNKSSSHRDSKSHRSSSSSQRHSSKHSDDKKSSNKDRSSESSKSSKDKSKDSKSSSHRSDKDKDKKSSKSKSDEKDKKKDKKDTDDHYSLSGRGNPSRRSTDRDSNDGSSSSKGSNNTSNNKPSESKKETKGGSSKSDNTSTSGESTSPCDKEQAVDYKTTDKKLQQRPIVRVETHLEMPIAAPPRLPFVPDVTLKKPKFAANFKEAKRLMKMRKFLDEEQKRMNQEAALLLEFQANVRPSLSQVYSSIPGPELEFACGNNSVEPVIENNKVTYEIEVEPSNIEGRKMTLQEIENIIGINVGSEMSHVVHIENFEESNEITNNVEAKIENNNIPIVKDTEINPENEIKHKTEELIIEVEQNKTEMEENNDSMSNDNKPFSDLIDEITKYKNASENKTNVTKDEENVEEFKEEVTVKIEEVIIAKEVENKDKILDKKITDKIQEISIDQPQETVAHIEEEENIEKIQEEVNKIKEESKKRTEYFEITIITEELSEPEDEEVIEPENKLYDQIKEQHPDEKLLEYFGEHEKYNAELERDRFSTFLNKFIERTLTNKMYLINCDTYEENIIREASEKFGHFDIVNYFKNGQSNLANVKNIVKDVNVAQEIKLPLENNDFVTPKSPINSPVFSPVKSECSFELSSEYDAKLEEMVNKTSRQEVMEIILGGVIDESPSEMPKIDYCTESNIDSEENLLKRKCEVESTVNNNRQVLTPNKIRKMSDSDQISSTTEETEEVSNNNRVQNNVRSKYLGRARRVGLSRPRKTNISNSPSSDKSVENYEHTSNPQIPNGKLKTTPRIKIQRYDTADLYKPKLHYLSRRNNIS